ncbi:hypothetical protein B5M09_013450, partial [Aphanomyces astaci]
MVLVLLDSRSNCAAIISRGLATRLSKRSGGGEMLTASMPQPMKGFRQRDVWDLADIVATDDSAPTALQRVSKTWHRGTVDEPDPVVDDEDDNAAAYAPDADHDAVVKELLLYAVRAAQANGLSEGETREVHSLVMAAIDVFRVAPRKRH